MSYLWKYKYILASLSAHVLVYLYLVSPFYLRDQVHLSDPNPSVDLNFESLFTEPQKRQKKKIRRKKLPKLADKVVKEEPQEEEVQQEAYQADLSQGLSSQLPPELKVFFREVARKIAENQTYPFSAKRLRQTGSVTISFSVFPDGHLQDIKIFKKSAYASLNQAALDLVNSVKTVEHFPKGYPRFDLLVPIDYEL